MNTSMLAERPAVVNRRFVPAVNEWEQGKRLYNQRQPIAACTTDEMAEGWCAAADLASAMKYLRVMEAEGMPYPVEVM